MRTIKYHLALTDNEYSLIINSLNNLRNDLIAQGRYTDAVDDVLVEFIGAKKKNFKIIYFTAVGMIDIPTEQEILAMMEEMQKNPQ